MISKKKSWCEEIKEAHAGDVVGWLGFNGTFSTNMPYRAIKKIKVCLRCLSGDVVDVCRQHFVINNQW